MSALDPHAEHPMDRPRRDGLDALHNIPSGYYDISISTSNSTWTWTVHSGQYRYHQSINKPSRFASSWDDETRLEAAGEP